MKLKSLKLNSLTDCISMRKHSKSKKKEKLKVKKEQVNLSLPVELVENMEDILFYAHQVISREKRKKLHKSKFYEIILRGVLENYIEEKSNSLLSDIIFRWGEIYHYEPKT